MQDNDEIYDYCQCHVCGETMEERRIKQDLWLKGKLIVIEDVPTGVCPQCGEKVVRADVGRQIATLIEHPQRLRESRIMPVQVVRFSEKVA